MLTLRQAAEKLGFAGPATSVRAMAQQLGLTPPISVRDLIKKVEDSPVGSWVSIGPTRIASGVGAGGRLTAIAITPAEPGTIYVGGAPPGERPEMLGCGVWKTPDGGRSWNPVTDSLPTQVIAAIAVDPSARLRVYVATPGIGIFRSEDAGQSWNQISNDLRVPVYLGVLLVHPTDPNVIYVTSADGVYRSRNFGKDWPLSKSGGLVTGLVMNPSNPDIIYAAIFGDGIYRTTDGGRGGDASWVKLTAPSLPTTDIQTIRLALCRDVPSTVYAGYSRSNSFEVHCTGDGGEHWFFRKSMQNVYIEVIGADLSQSATVYVSGVDFYRSDDGGGSFVLKAGAHTDHHAFAIDPMIPGVIYTLGDGGIFRSSDRGDHWSFFGEGITNVEFYDIANSVTKPSLVIGGTQDNGTIKYDGTSTVWQGDLPFGGDGATVDIDPTNDQILYGMYQFIDSISRSPDGGRSPISIGNIANGLPKNACQQGYFHLHPAKVTTLLACCNSLWRTVLDLSQEPPGSNWSPIFTPPSGAIVRSAVDPSVDLYYAGSNDGRLYAGPAGVNWQMVFAHPASSGISDIEVDPNTLIVYVSFGGGGTGRVYRLIRSSPAPSTVDATDITSNLPNGRSVNAIGVDPKTALTIYAGTDAGVYRGVSIDDGKTWSWAPYNFGLPPARVVDLEVHPTTGVMRAGTSNRGAFEVSTK